jgi:hypothetical protein
MKLPGFSLRELFLLVLIAAMGCGWWRDAEARSLWRWRAESLKEYLEGHASRHVTWENEDRRGWLVVRSGDLGIYFERKHKDP